MSVLIKGMEMPKSCFDCPMLDELMYCGITKAPYPFWKKIERLTDCPLADVPTPHGRLIDADKMCADLATVDPRYETMVEWCIGVTNAQPTIIETEGE